MKKLISFLLSITVLTSVLFCGAVTAEAKKSGDFEYDVLRDGTAEITAYLGKNNTITIPEKLDKYTVTSLGWNWLDEKTVRVLNVPATIIKIDGYPFPATHAVNIDENNPKFKSIGGVVFNKSGTKLLRFPPKKLRNSVYTVPDGVQTIGDSAFSHSELKGVNFYDSVTKLEECAFYSCEKLESVIIPEKVEVLELECFANDTNLKSVTFNKNLKTIKKNCFNWCASLKKVELPKGLERIENEAFGMTAISSIALPSTLKHLSGFSGTKIKSVNVPASVETIDDHCFADCEYLKTVSLHNGLKKIGDCAFFYCDSLKSLKIPSTVTSIEGDAFVETRITELVLPRNLKHLDNSKSDFGVFPDSLKKLTISKSNKYFSTRNGLLYNKKLTKFLYYPNRRGLKKLVFPKTVTSIRGNAFSGADLKKVVVGGRMKRVGKYAFAHSDIDIVVFGKGLRILDSYSFYFAQVRKIVLPNTVKKIEKAACRASSLRVINIPKSVRSIGAEAFFGADLGKVTIYPTVKTIGKEAIGILYGECGINGGVNKNTIIRCRQNSAAYKYAKKNKIKYELM